MADYLPHQQRVVDELQQLQNKLTALRNFIDRAPLYQRLDDAEKQRLRLQAGYMAGYAAVLGDRIEAFA